MTAEQLYQQAYRTHQGGNIVEAEQLYRAALEAAPEHAEANRYLGVLLIDKGEPAEAESFILRALDVKPEQASFHQNHAMALAQMGDWAASVAACERALVLKPTYARVWFDRGNALMQLGRFDDAILSFQRAIELGLRDATVFYALGQAFSELGKREQTTDFREQILACYENAVALKPDFLEAIVNRGALLMEMSREQEALVWFDRALVLDPRAAELHKNRGLALEKLRRLPEAREAFRKAMGMNPDVNYLRSALHWVERHMCDWQDYDAHVKALLDAIEAHTSPTVPFALLSLPATPAQQKICAQLYAQANHAPRALPPPAEAPKPHDKIRVAYVGACFSAHPVAVLMAEMLEKHDRDAFEILGVSLSADDGSALRARMKASVDHFLDARGLGDQRVALMLRQAGIDIAVDLDGYTQDCRPGILSWRPAPVQVNFLGYPGTMGASHIDYIIGDAVVTPPDQAVHYSEAIVSMPDSYQPNTTRPEPDMVSRKVAGLPETGFVFGCFNNVYKLTPQLFDSWMRILNRVPDSVLWLMANTDTVKDNLRREATARGVDPSRLFFAQHKQQIEHLARLQQMDLFLDTFLYGAHTTASDALWCAVPVVTVLGEAFPARVGSSLVSNVGLGELVTHSAQEYEDLAVALATDPARLTKLKRHLRDARRTAPVFDSARFSRNLESAYRTMLARHKAGEKLQGFTVSA